MEKVTKIEFQVDPRLYEVTVEPDSVLTVFAKIGGLLGLMRIFAVFSAVHEWQFERSLKKEHEGKKEKRSTDNNDET